MIWHVVQIIKANKHSQKRGGCIFKSLLASFVLILLISSVTISGEIYSYIDEKGVYHFTNVPTDNRFSKIKFTEKTIILKGKGEKEINQGKKSIDIIVQDAANSFDIDPALIKAVILAESGGNPLAVSPKGALGLMQLMPSTAKELLVEDPFDPEENIWGGSKYLSELLKIYNGDILSALAAYNAGPGTVKKYRGIPPYPETINYIKRVLYYWKEAKNN